MKAKMMLATAVALCLRSAAAAGEGLIVSAVTGSDAQTMMKLAFADHGSGAAKDLSVWDVAPDVAAAGWKIVGHVGEGGYGTASSLVVVKAGSDSAALAAPTSLSLNWQWDTTHGGAFFTPVCSAGYTALGSVATDKEAAASSKPSDFPGLVCVANKYLTGPTSVKLSNVWTSQGSHHFKMDGSVWSQPALKTEQGGIALPFVAGAASSFSAPAAPRRTIDPSKVQVVVMPKPPPPPPAPLVVEQVHLALGHTVETMAVSWSTVSSTPCESMVMYGSSATALSKTNTGNSRIFTQDPDRVWYTHAANMTGLSPGERYYYKVGNKNGSTEVWSEVFTFKAATTAKPKPGQPQLHVIYGDSKSAFQNHYDVLVGGRAGLTNILTVSAPSVGASHAYSLCPDCGESEPVSTALECERFCVVQL